MSNSTGNTLAALLTGAAIGATLGILFAPDKGSKTRAKIKDGFDETKNNFQDAFAATSEAFRDKFQHVKKDAESSYEDLVSNMSYKTEEIITFLEDKLATLKEKNAKLQK